MTQPTNSSQGKDGRLYVWPPTGEAFTSVTTILNVLSKPFLTKWAAKQAAEYAVRHWFDPEFGSLVDVTPDEAIKQMAGASIRYTEKASETGNDVHAWVEASIKGWKPVGEEPPHFKYFKAWEAVHRPEYVLCESTVYNRAEGYAGTMDFMAIIDGELTIVDVKSGKSVYPEVALQLAAYNNGEFIGKSVDDSCYEEGFKPATKGAVLHLRPQSYKHVPVRIDEEVWQAFRYVKEAFRWQQYTSKNVLNNGVKLTNWEPR